MYVVFTVFPTLNAILGPVDILQKWAAILKIQLLKFFFAKSKKVLCSLAIKVEVKIRFRAKCNATAASFLRSKSSLSKECEVLDVGGGVIGTFLNQGRDT